MAPGLLTPAGQMVRKTGTAPGAPGRMGVGHASVPGSAPGGEPSAGAAPTGAPVPPSVLQRRRARPPRCRRHNRGGTSPAVGAAFLGRRARRPALSPKTVKSPGTSLVTKAEVWPRTPVSASTHARPAALLQVRPRHQAAPWGWQTAFITRLTPCVTLRRPGTGSHGWEPCGFRTGAGTRWAAHPRSSRSASSGGAHGVVVTRSGAAPATPAEPAAAGGRTGTPPR